MPTNRKEYTKDYVLKNRLKINQQGVSRQRKRKQEAVEMLGNKCLDCQQQYPLACYDFHHIDPTQKDYNPYIVLSRKYEIFLTEIKKCILLCANCHRLRHYGVD